MQIQEKTALSISSVPLVAHRHQNLTGRKIISALQSALDLTCLWAARSRQRRALQSLDERLLDDIGLTREQAQNEASKFFWQD